MLHSQFKKKHLFLLLWLMFPALPGLSQKYITAAGVRIGRDHFGLTVQQKLWEKTTLEGIAALKENEVSGTAMLQLHEPLLGKRFNTYVGAGAHIGQLKDHGTFYGGDLILGLEYKLNFFPLLVSADMKPAFHVNHTDWFDFNSALSVRYVFIKEKPKKRKWWPFGSGDNDDRKKKSKKKKDEERKPFRLFNRNG